MLGIMMLIMALRTECSYAECNVYFIVFAGCLMPSIIPFKVVMLSVITLNVVMLSVIMLCVIMLSVLAPPQPPADPYFLPSTPFRIPTLTGQTH